MAVLSTLLKTLVRNGNLPKNASSVANQGASILRSNASNELQIIRQMSEHRTMAIKPSRWSWNKFKDMVHFYMMLGIIPSTLAILYINITIGPAKLAEIPENYVPEYHEYYAHPITRWLAKNVHRSYQQDYETMCMHAYEQEYKMKLRLAEKRIRQKMQENKDTQAFYYEPVTSRYERAIRDYQKETIENTGVN